MSPKGTQSITSTSSRNSSSGFNRYTMRWPVYCVYVVPSLLAAEVLRMENAQIIIPPDPMTKKISITSILTSGAAVLVCWFVFGDMPVARILICFTLLVLLLVLVIEFLTNIQTIVLTKGGCTFKLGKHQWSYCSNELSALVCTHNRFLTHGDALDGPGVIISAKPIPSSIQSDARSYCLFRAPLTSVFIRFSKDDDDEKITYRKGRFSSKGHTASKDEIFQWLQNNDICCDNLNGSTLRPRAD